MAVFQVNSISKKRQEDGFGPKAVMSYIYIHTHVCVCVNKYLFLSFLFVLGYAAAKSHQSCPTVGPHRRQPTRLPRPWDSPGKNTGVGCHFLLQCMKVKSENESYPTLRNPMDCSLPGSSVHGIFQARVLEWGAIAFSVY